MSFFVRGLDFPNTCLGCPFIGKFQQIRVPELEKVSEKHPVVYEEISRCMLSPDEIEDPWHETSWFYEHKEEWCPIKNLGKHGRLIDADALLAVFEKDITDENKYMELYKAAGDLKSYINRSRTLTGMVAFRRALEAAPTVIDAEEQS